MIFNWSSIKVQSIQQSNFGYNSLKQTIYNKVVVLRVTGSSFLHRFRGEGGGTYDLCSSLSKKGQL